MFSIPRSALQSRLIVSRIVVLALMLVTYPTRLLGSFEYERGSISGFALGGIVSGAHSSALALLSNPAAPVGGKIVAEGWVSRLYDLNEFELGAGGVAASLGRWTIGLTSSQLTGSDFYWENELSGIVAIEVSSELRLGVRLDRQEIEFAYGYGRYSLISVAVGTWWWPSRRVSLSAALSNLNRPRFTKSEPVMQLSGQVAVGYDLNPGVSIYAAEEISGKHPNRFKIGQRLAIINRFELLLGLGTDPTELSGGVVFDFLGFTVEYGYRENVYLGGTHRVGMTWAY